MAGRIGAAQSSGNFKEAAALYRQVIASGEDSPQLRSNLGAMLYLAGENGEALKHLRIALRQDAKLTGANLIAGLALSRLGQWRNATPYLERARRQDPSGIAPALALGKAYVAVRDYARANQAYVEATRLDVRNADAWYGAGITYRSLADAMLKKSTTVDTLPDVHETLHLALEALTKAAELDPGSARAHLILAESYRDSGKLPDALNEYRATLRLNPDDTAACLGLATTYWKDNQFEEAAPYAEKVLKRLADDPEANAIIAEVFQRRGNNQQAKAHALIAVRGNPGLVQARVLLAKIYLADKRPDLAASEMKAIAPHDPDGSYHFLLYRALSQLGREQEAAAALNRFKELRAKAGAAGKR